MDEDLLLDIEKSIACEYSDHDEFGTSDLPAAWRVVSGCCPAGRTFLWCTQCKNEVINDDTVIICQHCKRHYFPAYRAYLFIEPL